MDDDQIQRRLRRLAEEASPRPGSAEDVLRRGRVRRGVAAVGAGLMAIVLIGGVAGGAMLLGAEERIDPAPGPQENTECRRPGFDIAIAFGGATKAQVATLGKQLEADPRVAAVRFVPGDPEVRPRGQFGPIPSYTANDHFEVRLARGVRPRFGMFQEIVGGAGEHIPDRDCPPEQRQREFARYFFEVREGNTSASGVLEVDAEEASICLAPTLSSNITAVHLIDQVPDVPGARDESEVPDRSFALSFIDPQDPPEDSYTPSGGGATCLRDQDPALLQQIVDEPQRFALDFHRGPNDDPRLVAELKESPGEVATCASDEITDTDKEPNYSANYLHRWQTADGCDVRLDILMMRQGDEACGGPKVADILMTWPLGSTDTAPEDEHRIFVKDPTGVFHDDRTTELYQEDAMLPDDARDTGFRLEDTELWMVPGDDAFIYLVEEDKTERWPQVESPPVCA